MTLRIAVLSLALLSTRFVCATEPTHVAPAHPPIPKPLRALLITGGCCHDYATQTKHLTAAVAKIAPSTEWTIVHEGGTGTRAELPLFDKPDWASPYDIIVHNECFADTTSADYIRKITTAHRAGKPAVVIHCAMHSYRAAQIDDWRELLGVTSHRHDHQSRYLVHAVEPAHPALKDFPPSAPWLTPLDELYIIEKLWPTATPLAVSKSEKDGTDQPVIWINNYHGTRVFGTTFGHGNATWEDPVFQNLLANGVLWAAGREK